MIFVNYLSNYLFFGKAFYLRNFNYLFEERACCPPSFCLFFILLFYVFKLYVIII